MLASFTSHKVLSKALPPPQQELNQIYKKLILALGVDPYLETLPTLQLSPTQSRAAYYSPLENKIIIEFSLYEICKDMGEAKETALAFLIGHELGHYYAHTQCKEELGVIHNAEGILKKLSLTAQRNAAQNNELQADYFGGMVAYFAGYDVLNVLPLLFERAYQAYHLKEYPNYPPLSERLEVASQLVVKIRQLAALFELANALNLVKAYEQANACYEVLLQHFVSPETLNNYAVSLMREMREIQTILAKREHLPFAKKNFPMAFLFEIDPFYRLTPKEERVVSFKTSEQLLQLYQQKRNGAKQLLDSALKLNPHHLSAQQNMVLWYLTDLTEEGSSWEKAELYIQKMQQLPQVTKTHQLEIRCLEGLLLAKKGYRSAAIAFFENIKKNANNPFLRHLASVNYQLLREELLLSEETEIINSYKKPVIDKLRLYLVKRYTMHDQWKINEKYTYYAHHATNTKLLSLNHRYVFQLTNNDTPPPADLLNVLNSASLEEDLSYFQNSNKGYFQVFPHHEFAIEYNQNEEIVGWFLFDKL